MPHKLIKPRLESSGVWLDSLLTGVHLNGGCSHLPGICELAKEVFGIPFAARSGERLRDCRQYPAYLIESSTSFSYDNRTNSTSYIRVAFLQ